MSQFQISASSRTVFLPVLMAISATFWAPPAGAQAAAVAEVAGYVTDPSGQSIPGAQVKIVETGKNRISDTTTDARGRYSFPNLQVGLYDLDVTASGFKTYVESGILLQVASNLEINVKLQLGAVSETIDVKASATMVETKDNSITEVIDERRMVDLPLDGRNPTELITLTGAATTSSSSDLITSKNIGGSNASGTFSVAGGQANGVTYLLDGGDNNDPLFNVNLPLPFPDALQEFSVQTSALSAQYGLHPGAVVNAVTKSGTNSLHGDLFEFLRNGDLNAIQRNTPARDSLKRNQFGGVIGGKIIRDKLFFFAGYEGTRQRSNPPTQISYVATAAALNGDFSTLEAPDSAAGCLARTTVRQLKNPSNGVSFPNNQIPVSLFSQPAVMLLSKYLPVSSDPCGQVKYGYPANNPDDQVIGRVDYMRSAKNSLYGRYFIYDFTVETTFNGSNLLTTQQPGQLGRSQTVTLGDNYSFSPTTLNSFHATFDRRRNNRGDAPNVINPQTLGINMAAPIPNFIYLSVSSYFNLGCGTCSPGHFNTNTYQLSDDVNLIRGRNQFAFGGDFRRLQANLLTNTYTNGDMSITGGSTGDALADLLLGYIATMNQANPQPDALRQTVFSLYAQDNFRATPHVTLNLGLRWEPQVFPSDLFGRTPAFSQAAFNAGTISTVYPKAPAGLVFPGDPADQYGKSQVKSYWGEVSPRLGLVWDPTGGGKQTVRAGFALMHDTNMLYFPERWTYSPPWGSQVIISNPPGGFANPWAGQPGGNPFPSSGTFPSGGTYYIVPNDMAPTYMLNWNLTYQLEVWRNWLLQAGYLGTKSLHVWGQYDTNPSLYISTSSATTNLRRLLYLQNPAQGVYYAAIDSGDPNGNSKYNALLTTVQHRFAGNFTVLSNYTYSHCVSDTDLSGEVAGTYRENPFSRSNDRGSCMFDHHHIFNASFIAASPGIGQGWALRLTRKWQVSTIFRASSGGPLNILTGSDQSKSGQNNDRPDQILMNVYPAQQTTSQWILPSAFKIQAVGTFGNVGKDSLNGPGTIGVNAALGRTFQMTEKWGWMVRGEAFNIMNHGNWNNPASTTISSGQFGQITTFGSPRVIQFGMKLLF